MRERTGNTSMSHARAVSDQLTTINQGYDRSRCPSVQIYANIALVANCRLSPVLRVLFVLFK